MRRIRREFHTSAPPPRSPRHATPRLASPRHVTSRARAPRVARISPSRALFCHAWMLYEQSYRNWNVLLKWTFNTNWVQAVRWDAPCSFQLLSVRFIFCAVYMPTPLCLYKREVAPPLRYTATHPLRLQFQSTALLRSSPSRLATCTASRDSRPPRPRCFESYTGEGQ